MPDRYHHLHHAGVHRPSCRSSSRSLSAWGSILRPACAAVDWQKLRSLPGPSRPAQATPNKAHPLDRARFRKPSGKTRCSIAKGDGCTGLAESPRTNANRLEDGFPRSHISNSTLYTAWNPAAWPRPPNQLPSKIRLTPARIHRLLGCSHQGVYLFIPEFVYGTGNKPSPAISLQHCALLCFWIPLISTATLVIGLVAGMGIRGCMDSSSAEAASHSPTVVQAAPTLEPQENGGAVSSPKLQRHRQSK